MRDPLARPRSPLTPWGSGRSLARRSIGEFDGATPAGARASACRARAAVRGGAQNSENRPDPIESRTDRVVVSSSARLGGCAARPLESGMRLLPWVLVATIAGASGCRHARPRSLYQQWNVDIDQMASTHRRVDDVSLLLGIPPQRCDPVQDPDPVTGLSIDEGRVVRGVVVGGPAESAGIRPGDEVLKIAGRDVTTGRDAVDALRAVSRDGQPIEIELARGTVPVTPRRMKTEQCYWESHAGSISVSGGRSYVSAYGGASRTSGTAYERFFRASCRVVEGAVWYCQSNWQE